MNTDLELVAQYIREAGIWDKHFRELSEKEIRGLCEAIVEATFVEHGFKPPYIERDTLVIPFQAPMKYRFWQGGQSLKETLEELGASDEIKRQYIPEGYGEGFVLGVKPK